MKQIVTSYLNRRNDWEGFTRFRICRWLVHDSQVDRYDQAIKELYPTAEMIREFDQFETREDWIEAYTTEILGKLDPQEFYDALPEKSVLMCHEKTEDDGTVLCHRRIVADWLQEHCGVEVPEWLPPEQIERIEKIKAKDEQINTLLDF
jgi:hypothetical protein